MRHLAGFHFIIAGLVVIPAARGQVAIATESHPGNGCVNGEAIYFRNNSDSPVTVEYTNTINITKIITQTIELRGRENHPMGCLQDTSGATRLGDRHGFGINKITYRGKSPIYPGSPPQHASAASFEPKSTSGKWQPSSQP
jgi:hypothetical protein